MSIIASLAISMQILGGKGLSKTGNKEILRRNMVCCRA